MDSLDIKDEKDFSAILSKQGNFVLIDGVVDQALEMSDGELIYFKQISRNCADVWCFPMYTISTWIKYKSRPANSLQTLFRLSPLLSIEQNHAFGENRVQISANTAQQRCTFSTFLPSNVWSHIVISAKPQFFSMYVDGHEVTTSAIMNCQQRGADDVTQVTVIAGRHDTFNIAIDDLRISFDALDVTDTKRSYQLITGTVFVDCDEREEGGREGGGREGGREGGGREVKKEEQAAKQA